MDDERAPDPFRPAEIPQGGPEAKVGRPESAVLVVVLIVALTVALVVWALVR